MANLVSTQDTDWSQVFRDIMVYGSTRVLNPNATANLYAPVSGNIISPDGVTYQVGQNGVADDSSVKAQGGVVLPSGILLIAAGVLLYFVMKK